MNRCGYGYLRSLICLAVFATAGGAGLWGCGEGNGDGNNNGVADGGGDVDGGEPAADAGDITEQDTTPEPPADLELTAVENPSNALSFYIQWTTEEPVQTTLELDCGDGEYEQSYDGSEARTEHEVFVMGLWDGAECTASTTAEYDETEHASGSVTFTAGPVADFLPELDAAVVEMDKIQPGWTLFNLNNVFDSVPISVAMVDAQGRYRWYHQLATSDTGADSDVRTVEQGVLVGGNRTRSWPTILNWEGDVVWQREYRMHHAIRPYGDDQLIFLNSSPDCTGSAVIRKYDFSEDDIIWDWDLCDHWSPDPPTPDWSHINSLELYDDEQSVILSSRTQNTLFNVNLQTEELDWMMGELGDFDVSAEDQFYRQHSPEVQENGNILLFDNGNDERPFSRAIEIEYDVQAGTAEVVWEYRPDPDIYTPIWGDADRMENGNTLMTYGERQEDITSHLIEVTPDKQKVWELIAPLKWGWYRAERVVSPPVGHVVE